MKTPPPLPLPPRGPYRAAWASPCAGLGAILVFLGQIKLKNPDPFAPNLAFQILGWLMLLLLLGGLGLACYGLGSRRLFGAPAHFTCAIAGLLLNIFAGVIWVFPATAIRQKWVPFTDNRNRMLQHHLEHRPGNQCRRAQEDIIPVTETACSFKLPRRYPSRSSVTCA